MSTASFIQSIQEHLGLPKREPSAPSDEEAAREELFAGNEKKFAAFLKRHAQKASNRVYQIDLARLKPQFGERWKLLYGKITETTQESIERHLVEGDIYSQYGEASFVVLFAHLDRHEAQLKCLLVAKEVARRLIGTEAASSEITVKLAGLDEEGSLSFKDLPKLEEAASPPGGIPTGIGDRKLVVTPELASFGAMDWNAVQFLYRPLITMRGMVVSTFLCLAIRQTSKGAFDSGYDVLADPSNLRQVVDLDLLTLATVATEAVKVAAAGNKLLLALPVNFETLADHHHREKYLHYCREYLESHSHWLVFELVGLPDGIPQSRLIELVSLLRPYGRAVIARFTLDRKIFGACRSAGLHAVGADIHYSGERESVLLKKMDRFVEGANQEMLKTYIHGVRTTSMTTAAISAGFDYVDGYALTTVVDIPKRACRYDIHALYRSAALAG